MTTQQVLSAQTYDFDLAHSSADFSVKHLMIATVRGRMAIKSGHVEVDLQDVQKTRVVAEIDAASIHTGDEKRDGHLRSGDFLNAEAHPTLNFESTRVERVDANKYRVEGNLTIRGTTRPITLDVDHEGEAKDPWGNKHIALVGRTTLDRTQWGLSWNAALETGGVLVGEKVKVEINVELVERKAS
ncbi:MAG: YceI family protein [Candidatus Thermoplasmatota archaeon]